MKYLKTVNDTKQAFERAFPHGIKGETTCKPFCEMFDLVDQKGEKFVCVITNDGYPVVCLPVGTQTFADSPIVTESQGEMNRFIERGEFVEQFNTPLCHFVVGRDPVLGLVALLLVPDDRQFIYPLRDSYEAQREHSEVDR